MASLLFPGYGMYSRTSLPPLGKWLNHFSYDFMCDMVYIFSRALRRYHSPISLSSYRYRGGSELLRDGDENNVWALLDHGVILRLSSAISLGWGHMWEVYPELQGH
ncbi:hypothetical protein C8T65DRAFT_746848 [Cerioporus squamosus]|nr:hypothetical protein C8T65DRAFT_746848 [Cerioporus squamosus]